MSRLEALSNSNSPPMTVPGRSDHTRLAANRADFLLPLQVIPSENERGRKRHPEIRTEFYRSGMKYSERFSTDPGLPGQALFRFCSPDLFSLLLPLPTSLPLFLFHSRCLSLSLFLDESLIPIRMYIM